MQAVLAKFRLQTPAQMLALFLVPILIFGMAACNTSWIGQAEQIVTVLAPAVTGILGLVLPFAGVALPAADIALVNGIVQNAGPALAGIQSLLNQYKSALPADRPAILDKINAGLAMLQKNLATILAGIHVKDQALLSKVEAVVNAVVGEIQQLEGLLPFVQGRVTAARAHLQPTTAKQFKSAYNTVLLTPSGSAAVDQAAAQQVIK